jgi:hypothetical protein
LDSERPDAEELSLNPDKLYTPEEIQKMMTPPPPKPPMPRGGPQRGRPKPGGPPQGQPPGMIPQGM